MSSARSSQDMVLVHEGEAVGDYQGVTWFDCAVRMEWRRE
jgi:hypothetical protein